MLTDLRLQRFRSYRDQVFSLEPGVNIIVGPNASGKTNLLEALLVVCRGSSFRAKDAELIAFGAPWARIDAQGPAETRTIKYVPQANGLVKKEFVINNQIFARLSHAKSLPVVLFEPNHLLLLHGSPEARRDYLDNLLEQLQPGYATIRRNYRRALAQRNALLKRGHTAIDQLFAWNIRLSDLGAHVARARHELVQELAPQLQTLYATLAPDRVVIVSAEYATMGDIEHYGSRLLQALERRQSIDVERGFTTVGPHRDDLIITFDGRAGAEVASRGETRTVLLALKIIELKLLESIRDGKPLLLLDDVFSELDTARRRALTKVIDGYQACITTTDADVVARDFKQYCHLIRTHPDR